jgi:hypothetical protein
MKRAIAFAAASLCVLAAPAFADDAPPPLRFGHVVGPVGAGAVPKQVAQQTDDGQAEDDTDRRRPGPQRESTRVEPVNNPGAVPPPAPLLPREFIPIPDRWRLVDALGLKQEHWWDPYNQNELKADKPLFGEDWFLNLSLISDTVYEASRVPTPNSFAVTATPGEQGSFGRSGHTVVNQAVIGTVSLIKGNTAYKPPEWEFRLTPVFNFNRLDVQELGFVNIDPRRGTTRNDTFVGLQEGFVDYHIRNVSERYDFDSLRVGIQPFSTDFRGFLFQDDQLGVRLFGNRSNNLFQYNLAYFRRLEKDTNSGLNDITQPVRDDEVIVANIYRQDLPITGFTSQLTYVYNRNREGNQVHVDNNGFTVRPAQIGDTRGHDYDVSYIGYNGDGHFGRFNLTHSIYYAFGTDSHNQFSGRQGDANISAWFAAAEPSIDFDWIRVRLSGLYASGDGNPSDGHETGFDAIRENPLIAGADTSYWIRQGIPLVGGGILVKAPNSVLPALRSSGDESQSNFVNPGIFLAGVGTDMDLLPELRFSTNFNYLAFANTASLEFLRQQGSIPNGIGYDISGALTYRPGFIQNFVFRLSSAILIPDSGLKRLYAQSGNSDILAGGKFLYSTLLNMAFTY